MSKKAKAAQKIKRLQKKRARKAANKVKYEELKRLGLNTKSKRSIGQGKKQKKVNTISHPEGKCGNIGCIACDPYKVHKIAA